MQAWAAVALPGRCKVSREGGQHRSEDGDLPVWVAATWDIPFRGVAHEHRPPAVWLSILWVSLEHVQGVEICMHVPHQNSRSTSSGQASSHGSTRAGVAVSGGGRGWAGNWLQPRPGGVPSSVAAAPQPAVLRLRCALAGCRTRTTAPPTSGAPPPKQQCICGTRRSSHMPRLVC